MKKSSALGMMLMMGAMMEHQDYGMSMDMREDKPKTKKPIKKIIPKGLKEFFYGEKVIYALNKKNADRKALKQGLIIADVSNRRELVCNYCLEQVDTLPDDFGCQSCIDNYK